MTTNHPGRCATCDERIHEGDLICATADGWVHDECATSPPPLRHENPVCPACWLTHPEGKCDL